MGSPRAGCKNGPAPFPDRMSYKATKLVDVKNVPEKNKKNVKKRKNVTKIKKTFVNVELKTLMVFNPRSVILFD